MSLMWSVVSIILSLLLVVGVHEAGHAWAASLFKVNLIKISIGFGKPLLSWKGKNGCQWCWSTWPLGGYVTLLNSRIEPVSNDDLPFCFDKKPVAVRCFILLAGALGNILMAWLALALMLMLGYQQMTPVIEKIENPSIASQGGLLAGDQLMALAGRPTTSWSEVGRQVLMNLGQKDVPVVVENKLGEKRQLTIDLNQLRMGRNNKTLLQALGIFPDAGRYNLQHVSGLTLFAAGYQAFWQIVGVFYFLLIILKQLIMGIIPFSVLLGPLGLFSLMIHSFFQGLVVFLYFISNLNLAIAFINLLPIPGLDGGSIVYALLEKIRGQPVSVAMEVLLHRLVFIVFCLLLVHVLMNDVQRFLH